MPNMATTAPWALWIPRNRTTSGVFACRQVMWSDWSSSPCMVPHQEAALPTSSRLTTSYFHYRTRSSHGKDFFFSLVLHWAHLCNICVNLCTYVYAYEYVYVYYNFFMYKLISVHHSQMFLFTLFSFVVLIFFSRYVYFCVLSNKKPESNFLYVLTLPK